MNDTNDRDPLLGQLIDRLEDRQPATDLWQSIAPHLKPVPWWRRREIGIAAGLLLLIGASIATGWHLRPTHVADDHVAAIVPVDSGATILPVGYDHAEPALAAALGTVEARFAEVADRLDPETRAALDEALAVLDSAISRARVRAGNSPHDLGAASELTSMMRRKLGVLSRVSLQLSRS